MKKVCVLVLIQLLVFGTVSYGAVSEDMYVRKDVFDAKMEAFMAEMRLMNEQVRSEIRDLNARIDGMEKSVNTRIDGVEKSVNARIDGLDARVDDLRNDIYLGLVILGIVVSWLKVKKAVQELRKSAPSITLEDVKRLIEEHDMKSSGKPQA